MISFGRPINAVAADMYVALYAAREGYISESTASPIWNYQNHWKYMCLV